MVLDSSRIIRNLKPNEYNTTNNEYAYDIAINEEENLAFVAFHFGISVYNLNNIMNPKNLVYINLNPFKEK